MANNVLISVEAIREAVFAIENTLGLLPQGTQVDVRTRLDAIESRINTINTTQSVNIISSISNLSHNIDGYYYPVSTNDSVLVFKISDYSTPFSVVLPSSVSTGRIYKIKDGSGTANTDSITIKSENASIKIDGATQYVISIKYESIDLIYNGSEWNIL